MMKLVVVLLLAVTAAAAATESGPRLSLGGVKRVSQRVWETPTGVTVLCSGRRRASDRPVSSVELQLSAVLDVVCRYLDSGTSKESAVGDLSSGSQQPDQDYVDATKSYHSVRYVYTERYSNN